MPTANTIRPLALILTHDAAHADALTTFAHDAGCEAARAHDDESGIGAMRRVAPRLVVLDAIEHEISDEFFRVAGELGTQVVIVAPGKHGDFERGAMGFSVLGPAVEAKGKAGIVRVLRAATRA